MMTGDTQIGHLDSLPYLSWNLNESILQPVDASEELLDEWQTV